VKKHSLKRKRISRKVRSAEMNFIEALVFQCEKQGWWDAAAAGDSFRLALRRAMGAKR